MAILALFSGTYSHGEEIAAKVAANMGYKRIGDALIDESSRRFHIPKEKFIRAITGPLPLFNKFTREREKHIAGYRKVLADLLEDDNLLLHGFAAHLLPSTISHVLKVCCIANRTNRINLAMSTESVSEREASHLITNEDELRNHWTTFLFNRRPYDARLYDIVIPTHTTPVEDAARIIETSAVSTPLLATDESLQAIRDFILSAEVNLKLVESGHDVDVIVENKCARLIINKHITRLGQFREDIKAIAASVEGIREVVTEIGPRFNTPSINPMARIDAPDRILICDVEHEFVHSLSERLQLGDLKSSVVYDSRQALDFVERGEPSVMVLDLMMPDIDGMTTLKKIRNEHPDIRVIILTGNKTETEQATALELGAYAYLEKPVNVDLMAEIMRRAYQEAYLEKSAKGKSHL